MVIFVSLSSAEKLCQRSSLTQTQDTSDPHFDLMDDGQGSIYPLSKKAGSISSMVNISARAQETGFRSGVEEESYIVTL